MMDPRRIVTALVVTVTAVLMTLVWVGRAPGQIGVPIPPYTTPYMRTLLDDADASTARTTLGVVIGTNVQAYDADLTTYAGITPSADVQTLLGKANTAAIVSQLAHKATHIDDGADAIDGDKLEISFTGWNNLTPDTGISEADSADDLAAILEGIDDALGAVTGATASALDADESTDASLSSLGDVHIRGDEDRFSFHAGAGGEVAGEVTKSMLYHYPFSFDPGTWYDSNDVAPLLKVNAKVYPNGIIIDYWGLDCMLDPDVEMDLDLCYADGWDDVADPNVMDQLDTTTGSSSEDTDANINSGNAVAAGKVVYLRFGADPEGTCTMLTGEIIFHAEED